MDDLVCARPEGLYCPPGDFYIDPLVPVPTAVLTHAHGDHARSGSGRYYAAAAGLPLLTRRLDDAANVSGFEYGERFNLGRAEITLHPAGHILGSAQVRIEVDGQVWVVSGDYKRAADPTCDPFEVVRCDVFVTESTFGLPIYRWSDTGTVVSEIVDWWRSAQADGAPAVLFCYALGKAQRLLAELASDLDRPVYLHGALLSLTQAYREAGVALPVTAPITSAPRRHRFVGDLVLAPPSAAGTSWMRRFPRHTSGFASGWMRVRGNRRWRGYDRGFTLSDHADWPALLQTVRETGARRVLCMHGRTDVLVRYLREQGLAAEPLALQRSDEAG